MATHKNWLWPIQLIKTLQSRLKYKTNGPWENHHLPDITLSAKSGSFPDLIINTSTLTCKATTK